LLEQIGILERTILHGDRRDYYRISRDGWHRFMQTRIETMRRLRRNAEHGLRVLEGEPAARRERLERMRRLYAFLEREIPRLLERFVAEESGGEPSYRADIQMGGRV
jgi:DNA-binding transcriptional regulator GbsR (MarR family)